MFYTAKQAAQRLNMPLSSLRRHLREGAIRAGHRPGGTIYVFSEAQLKAAERLLEGEFDAVSTPDAVNRTNK